jgi:two-component system sensor kinase FixL
MFNKACERLFGYAAGEVLGHNVKIIMPSDYADHHDHYVRHYISSGVRKIIGIGRDVQGRHRDGSVFPIHLSVGEAVTPEGRQFIGILRDLRARHDTEQRLNQLQADLLRMARVSAMDEMGAALAHELNQPLTALSAYLQGATRLLAQTEGEKSEMVTGAMQKATAQALRAGDVIRRLREFVARGETERRIESLAKLVQETYALAVVAGKDQAVRFELALDPSVDLVLVNKIQIQQVLLNLIRNGLEAMKDSPRRQLLVASAPAPNGMVRVSVADTGSGIAPDVAARLFQSFVTTKKSGLGVGLSISRTIIEAHGGRIAVEPNPGGGTIFRFTVRSGVLQDDGDEAQ